MAGVAIGEGRQLVNPALNDGSTSMADGRSPDLYQRVGARRALDATLFTFTTAAVLFVPLIVTPEGRDHFRDSKEYLFRAMSLAAFATLILRLLFWRSDTVARLRRLKAPLALTALAVLWTAVATIFSTNSALSAWSLARVLVCAMFFLSALLAVQARQISAVYVMLVPAGVNTVVLLLQNARWWDPFFAAEAASRRTALVGNSNDVGSYLLAAALAAMALAVRSHWRSAPAVALALLLSSGILASNSVTAIVSFAAGVLVILRPRSWRGAAMAVTVVLLLAAATPLYQPLKTRVETARGAIAAGDYNLLTSNRLTAWAAAVAMLRDHPLTGVGPGAYSWQYFDYKIAAESKYALLRRTTDRRVNFGDPHSDHLHILAISGVPGYASFIAGLVWVGARGRAVRRRGLMRPEATFASIYAPALAASVALLTLAQFPLELAASTVTLLYAAAICSVWSTE